MLELGNLLRESFQSGPGASWSVLAVRLGTALTLGCVVAGVYRHTRRQVDSDTQSIVPTLVLLTVLIAMVTLVIGDNIARAFGLVGALSIVRFRTVVEDTRDTAFVIFAVTVGMAVGAGLVVVPLVGIPFTTLAAILFRPRTNAADASALNFFLTVRAGIGHDVETSLRNSFEKHVTSSRLLSTATSRQGAALTVTLRIRLRKEDGAIPLVSELNGMEGIEGVELRRP